MQETVEDVDVLAAPSWLLMLSQLELLLGGWARRDGGLFLGGKEGDVGDIACAELAVRGGGGGGARRANKSELLSGTGGLGPLAGGGEVSPPSDDDG